VKNQHQISICELQRAAGSYEMEQRKKRRNEISGTRAFAGLRFRK
jgi:hypothetical protein